MSEPQETMPVGASDLVGAVARLFAEGYRIVQIGCSTLEGGYELTIPLTRTIGSRICASRWRRVTKCRASA
jgi:ech hydrogenase subunit D